VDLLGDFSEPLGSREEAGHEVLPLVRVADTAPARARRSSAGCAHDGHVVGLRARWRALCAARDAVPGERRRRTVGMAVRAGGAGDALAVVPVVELRDVVDAQLWEVIHPVGLQVSVDVRGPRLVLCDIMLGVIPATEPKRRMLCLPRRPAWPSQLRPRVYLARTAAQLQLAVP
jgi:hypothetical protein